MKPIPPVALATWMLEHLTFGCRNESLSGDLLEELRAGRSESWYWRQALSAIAITLSSQSRAYVFPLVFSTGWSLLYPAWRLSVMKSRVTQAIFEQSAVHDWPYSTLLQLLSTVIPIVTFVWIGFFAYLILRDQVVRQLSVLRLLGSLSISLNVLFVATIGQHLVRDSRTDVRSVSPEDLSSHLFALSIPLALSLLSALVCALPPMQQRHRGADSPAV